MSDVDQANSCLPGAFSVPPSLYLHIYPSSVIAVQDKMMLFKIRTCLGFAMNFCFGCLTCRCIYCWCRHQQ